MKMAVVGPRGNAMPRPNGTFWVLNGLLRQGYAVLPSFQ